MPEAWQMTAFLEYFFICICTSTKLKKAQRCNLQEDGSAETAAQNILAIALSLLLTLAFVSILWRVIIVSWALISAAVRYSVVAVLLVVLTALFF